MKHLDLFSGIGGFAYAVDQVWENAEHIFCDNDKFCQQVIKKHWPNSKIYEDIKFITNTEYDGWIENWKRDRIKLLEGIGEKEKSTRNKQAETITDSSIGNAGRIDLLTGGFPCQPFSQAGKRRGTEDNRFLWPEMFRVIQLTKPQWVIAENVRGLLTQQGGLVFEQVCSDLEAEDYEVQPFIIPAVAVNAPHRRDRVWFVANRTSGREWSGKQTGSGIRQSEAKVGNGDRDAPNSKSDGRGEPQTNEGRQISNNRGWDESWLEVATELCGVDDGFPVELDGFELSKVRHRVERLKSLGNAIVPQVVIEIMKAIKNYDIKQGTNQK